MLFKRTTIALALAAALLAAVPAAPGAAPSSPGAPVAPHVSISVANPDEAPSYPAHASVADVASLKPIGSWAIVSWGFQHGTASNAVANSTSSFWYEQGSLAGVGLGCGFIGTGIGLVNPLAGLAVGFGCSWGIGA